MCLVLLDTATAMENDRVELYNLREDQGEKHDLAPRKGELTKKMADRLLAWQRQVEAEIPQPNPGWQERFESQVNSS